MTLIACMFFTGFSAFASQVNVRMFLKMKLLWELKEFHLQYKLQDKNLFGSCLPLYFSSCSIITTTHIWHSKNIITWIIRIYTSQMHRCATQYDDIQAELYIIMVRFNSVHCPKHFHFLEIFNLNTVSII